VSELPSLETALLAAARRRYARPWWRPTVTRAARLVASGLAIVVAVAGIATLVLPIGADRPGIDERPATRPAERWTTTVNRAHGFTISLPAGWALSPESLTPHLSEPRERLSAGTFPLRFREGPCNHMPVGALRSIGPRDGFLTILERGRDRRSSWAGFPPRPRHFADRAQPQRGGDVSACLGRKPGLIEYWMPFTDAGRHFYAMIVLGSDADAAVRAQAFEILDRLRFDPAVQPDWRASG
jgi:hypothetical protein